MNEEFTITIFSENSIGLLNRITIHFTKRKLSIDSLTVSESAIKGVYKFIIVVRCAVEIVENLVKQLDKQIDIIRTFFLREKDVLHQEMAMYKIETSTFFDIIF